MHGETFEHVSKIPGKIDVKPNSGTCFSCCVASIIMCFSRPPPPEAGSRKGRLVFSFHASHLRLFCGAKISGVADVGVARVEAIGARQQILKANAEELVHHSGAGHLVEPK